MLDLLDTERWGWQGWGERPGEGMHGVTSAPRGKPPKQGGALTIQSHEVSGWGFVTVAS